MAEEALKKLLNCAVCLGTYTDPKLLQCFHVYCRACLAPLVVRDDRGELSLSCPTCRQVTAVPENGVSGFQPAFHITHLLEIRDSFAKVKRDNKPQEAQVGGPEVEAYRASNRSLPEQSLPSPTKNICSDHGEEVKLYCGTCDILICWKCAIKGGQHQDHNYEVISDAFDKCREKIYSLLKPTEGQLDTVNKALSVLDTTLEAVSTQCTAIEANMQDTFEALHQQLDIRKNELISQLHKVTQEKTKTLSSQRDRIETTQMQLSSCIRVVKESLGTSPEEVLKMKASRMEQIRDLSSVFEPYIMVPVTQADVKFTMLPDVHAECRNCGQISAQHLPDPSKCYTLASKTANVGETSTVTLQVVNFEGGSYTRPVELESELVSEVTGVAVSARVSKQGKSQYEVSYVPTIKGRHHLTIRLDGHHIQGSPLPVNVSLPVREIGTPILIIPKVYKPWDLAFSLGGELLAVAEFSAHCISIFSPRLGSKLRSFGVRGCGEEKFVYPRGVAVDREGLVTVIDSNSHRKFTDNGVFLSEIDRNIENTGPFQSYYPKRVTYNTASDKLYVVDWNSKVHVLNTDLTYCFSFGQPGNLEGEFKNPCGIASDTTGNVYVADSLNHRIQVFSPEGKFLRMFGKFGKGEGELSWPVAVAVDDPRGTVYVSEHRNHRVSVFTPEGKHLLSFGKEGNGPGEFINPCGVAVDQSGVLYVCDSYNDRIQLF